MSDPGASGGTGRQAPEPTSAVLPHLYRRVVETARLATLLPRGRYRRTSLPGPRALELAALWLVERLPPALHRFVDVRAEGRFPLRPRGRR